MTSRGRYSLLVLGPILVVLLNAWVAYHSLAKLFDADKWLTHTLEVITQADETQLAMSSANSAARAYLLTGSGSYADRYHATTGDVSADVSHLQRLTSDNVSQQRRIAFLRKRIGVRLGALDAAMGMRRAHGFGALSPAVLAPALNDSPDGNVSVRSVLAEVQAEERRLLRDRYDEARAQRRNVVLSFGIASLLDLALIVLGFQLLSNSRRDQEQLGLRAAQINLLNAELNDLNTELERRVEQRTRELEVSNQELQAFSYSVSHDLRAPLRTIDGFSLALAEDFAGLLNEEGRDYIQRVRGGVQRMGLLIDALLQLSRVTRSEVQRETFNLSDLVTQVFVDLKAIEPERTVSFTSTPGVIVDADPRLMRVAFENLLGNALKFTSKVADARVSFGAEEREGKIVYYIRDNGAGFDMKYVDRLFTAFQRLHGDRDFKGSGIGLATVSRIIRRHHGEIWAEAATGAGATFYFTLNA